MIKRKELEDYVALLRAHDWRYSRSDDYTVWNKGKASYENLIYVAKTDPLLKDLFDIWGDSVFQLRGQNSDTLNTFLENLRQRIKDENEES